jgi:hypothetical chaperone protein
MFFKKLFIYSGKTYYFFSYSMKIVVYWLPFYSKTVIHMPLNDFCGLDFGTSNSTIGVFKNQEMSMVPLEQGRPIIRSAIFFDYEADEYRFGQQGFNDYLSGIHGRLMMSLKSVLGSSLMKEHTLIDKQLIPYTTILGYLIQYMKVQAQNMLGHELTQVVMGRPVRFHDQDDTKDKLAQATLQAIAEEQGFETVLFQYEPIAAALAYEQTLHQEKLALIVDLGGGTSDFSVIRLGPNRQAHNRIDDVLANKGIHIGGTDFDTLFSLKEVMPTLGLGGLMQGISNTIQIPNAYYHDLTTWHTINSLYTHHTKRAVQSIKHLALDKKPIERLLQVINHQQGHRILNAIEQAKCLLSQDASVDLNLTFIEADFTLHIERKTFEAIIQHKIEQLIHTVSDTIQASGVKAQEIDSIFFTGGSTQIPIVRQAITNLLPAAEIVQGDVFSSVGKGLVIEAKKQFA